MINFLKTRRKLIELNNVSTKFCIFTAAKKFKQATWRELLCRAAVHHPDGHEVGRHRPPAVHQERVSEPESQAGVALESHQVRPLFVLQNQIQFSQSNEAVLRDGYLQQYWLK